MLILVARLTNCSDTKDSKNRDEMKGETRAEERGE